jgi:predicted dehydrogenase
MALCGYAWPVIKVGIIGMGFMGRTHASAYRAVAPLLAQQGVECALVAVCDPNRERLTGLVQATGNLATQTQERLWDPGQVGTFTDATAFFESEIDLVSICTHTDSHVTLGTAAMRSGKHVLMEKPVALSVEGIETLQRAAQDYKRICIPAMCMRYWPGWMELKRILTSGALGSLRSITFQRLGTAPGWGGGFYHDDARSGGVLFDLHIHDADIVQHLFGVPTAVRSVGDSRHVTTQYIFANGPKHVVAEGAWDLAPTTGFRMRYLANFERGTLDFDLARTPTLMLHTAEGSTSALEECAWTNGYEGEVMAAVLAAAGKAHSVPTLEEAKSVTRMLIQEREAMAHSH